MAKTGSYDDLTNKPTIPSIAGLATETYVDNGLATKIDKEAGKGLSTNDYTTTEKTKLSGIETGAQVNAVTSVAGKTGAVTLAKGDVGLGNVDNTSDANKPISTATQTALDGKVNKVTTVNTLYGVNGSGNQASYLISQSSDTSSIAQRSSGGSLTVGTPTANAHATTKAYVDAADTAHTSNTSNPHNVTKAQVGLGNVDNTSDADKPISTATQTALDGKVNKAGDTMTGLLESNAGILGYKQSRGGVGVTFGANSNGHYQVFNDTSSANIVTFYSDGSGFEMSGTFKKYIYGSGFPNGVVSASVGSIYIDTNVTNGASSWIKKSGSGNTGWSVLEGDTGWRDVSSLITPSGFFSSGGLYIRRTNNTLSIQLGRGDFGGVRLASELTAVNTTIASFKTLNGFRVASPTYMNSYSGSGVTNFTRLYLGTSQDASVVRLVKVDANVPAGTLFRFSEGQSTVNDDWPATLPGTAV